MLLAVDALEEAEEEEMAPGGKVGGEAVWSLLSPSWRGGWLVDGAARGDEAAMAGMTRDASSLLDAIVLELWFFFRNRDLGILERQWRTWFLVLKLFVGKCFFDRG